MSATKTETTANNAGVNTIEDNGNGTGAKHVIVDSGGIFGTQYAEDAPHVSGDLGTQILAVRRDTAASSTASAGDYATVNVDANGRLWERSQDDGPAWTPVRANLSSADASSAADLSAAPTSGQKIVIDDWFFSADTAMRIDLIEETSGTVVWSAYVPANGSIQFTPRDGLKLDTADKKVRCQTSASGNVRGTLLYHSAV